MEKNQAPNQRKTRKTKERETKRIAKAESGIFFDCLFPRVVVEVVVDDEGGLTTCFFLNRTASSIWCWIFSALFFFFFFF